MYVLSSFLVNALFVTYLGMLPYALAPLGILALYMLAAKTLSINNFVKLLFLILNTTMPMYAANNIVVEAIIIIGILIFYPSWLRYFYY